MKRAEIQQQMNAWVVKANKFLEQFPVERNKLDIELLDYNIKIGRVAGGYWARKVSKEDVEVFKREMVDYYGEGSEDEREFTNYIDTMLALPSYKATNVFAALRIYGRRRIKVLAKFRLLKEEGHVLLDEIKSIGKDAKEHCSDNASAEAGLLVWQTLDFWKQFKKIIDEPLTGSKTDFMVQIEAIFKNSTITRDELLQVITIDKSLKWWDGSRRKIFKEVYSRIPEKIDYEAFKEIIFIEKIEHEQDCYLMDIFMHHMFSVMDKYKKETGEDMIDTFGILEEITGKPIQTFTSKLDEYGDIVDMVPNKPNLKVVK
ncbi:MULTISPECIES: hypothetical protein [unclassified Paenibacillus]|uniref:hypothetical protein n=1 Tax=unclassified Paenibacillus TaxID=185978 RepID=UPI0009A911E2|nr:MULTISPECIES: hypothetical protein [unclassified Paenibacillus]SLJ92767.1 hypothetical protein SAMN06272722_1011144 [Paenibacillus sp. RU5A]SOC58504.1 hypothetical protein SAMN05880581_10146 [Paenibacillus sp. RU26A]SOC67556.1 hypothetical protein SAMN05880586_10146 [Paenibacillus sp. RU5M]